MIGAFLERKRVVGAYLVSVLARIVPVGVGHVESGLVHVFIVRSLLEGRI